MRSHALYYIQFVGKYLDWGIYKFISQDNPSSGNIPLQTTLFSFVGYQQLLEQNFPKNKIKLKLKVRCECGKIESFSQKSCSLQDTILN